VDRATQLHRAVRLQDAFPGLFVSYKQINGPPEKASVVVFHGKPRPHEVTTGWVPEVWKVGGLTRADLDVICNTAKEKMDRQCAERHRARAAVVRHSGTSTLGMSALSAAARRSPTRSPN
jgi:hypothetical protein